MKNNGYWRVLLLSTIFLSSHIFSMVSMASEKVFIDESVKEDGIKMDEEVVKEEMAKKEEEKVVEEDIKSDSSVISKDEDKNQEVAPRKPVVKGRAVISGSMKMAPARKADASKDSGKGAISSFVSDVSAINTDEDHDGRFNYMDNCVNTPNPSQEDMDRDGVGDACDNCREVANPGQEDFNDNAVGDVCGDIDNDEVMDANDNCPTVSNIDQSDANHDGIGNACDPLNCPDPVFEMTVTQARCTYYKPDVCDLPFEQQCYDLPHDTLLVPTFHRSPGDGYGFTWHTRNVEFVTDTCSLLGGNQVPDREYAAFINNPEFWTPGGNYGRSTDYTGPIHPIGPDYYTETGRSGSRRLSNTTVSERQTGWRTNFERDERSAHFIYGMHARPRWIKGLGGERTNTDHQYDDYSARLSVLNDFVPYHGSAPDVGEYSGDRAYEAGHVSCHVVAYGRCGKTASYNYSYSCEP